MQDYSLVQNKLDEGNTYANQIFTDKYTQMKEIVGL